MYDQRRLLALARRHAGRMPSLRAGRAQLAAHALHKARRVDHVPGMGAFADQLQLVPRLHEKGDPPPLHCGDLGPGPDLLSGGRGRQVLAALVAALQGSGESAMRALAAQGLGQATLHWARQPILAAYQANDQAALARASAALNQIAIQAFTPLRGALRDRDSSVRAVSAMALGMLAQPQSLDALREVWQDPSAEVRQAAVNATGLMGDPRASY